MFSSDDSKGREVDIDRLGNSIFCFSSDCRADTSMKILHVEVIVVVANEPCRAVSGYLKKKDVETALEAVRAVWVNLRFCSPSHPRGAAAQRKLD